MLLTAEALNDLTDKSIIGSNSQNRIHEAEEKTRNMSINLANRRFLYIDSIRPVNIFNLTISSLQAFRL